VLEMQTLRGRIETAVHDVGLHLDGRTPELPT
jgi:hypothetical protein